ncbi:MAG: polysaccharide deacetylase family protein [Bacteroidota bacterium]
MKKISLILYITVILEFNLLCYSQNVVSPYEVGTWLGFCNAAISYTFDDNCSNQLALAVPMFNNYGFKLTLFTVTNWSPNWAGLKSAALQGHEIANHTVSHANFGTLTVDQQKTEISTASNLINSNVTDQKCITFAYPYCAEGNDSLCALYFVAARGCQGFIEPSTPGNFMNVSSIVCGNLGSVKTEQDFKTKADNVASSKGWLVYLIHGIDNDGGYSPLPSATLTASLQYLNANKDKFWVSTFGNVARYIKERNCLSVTETSYQDSSITLQVTDTLDNELYNVPVTVRRPLPENWSSAIATQNGLPINASIVDIDSIKYVMFDVVPDGGEIELIKTSATGIKTSRGSSPVDFTLDQNYPNPFNPTTQINYSVPKSGYVSLKVFNLLGEEVATLFAGMQHPGEYVATFDGAGLASGVYLYRLEAENVSIARRLVLVK